MAIEDILKAIDAQALSERDAVLAEARRAAEEIVVEATARAAEMGHARAQRAMEAAAAEQARVVSAARQQARATVSAARSVSVLAVRDAARDKLAEMSAEQEEYARFMRSLGSEAAEGLSGEFVLHVSPRDATLGGVLADEFGSAMSVQADLAGMGGIVIETGDGRIVRDNTLETRLESAWRLLQADVMAALLS